MMWCFCCQRLTVAHITVWTELRRRAEKRMLMSK